jgi:D-alanine--poly(phosphoribitol) ligase subunit 2
MTERVLSLIQRCTREVAEQREVELTGDLGADTRLFGKQGLFDSLGLVTLVVTVEEAIEEEYGVILSLANERAMSQKRSPFLTIESLAEWANSLIEEAS